MSFYAGDGGDGGYYGTKSKKTGLMTKASYMALGKMLLRRGLNVANASKILEGVMMTKKRRQNAKQIYKKYNVGPVVRRNRKPKRAVRRGKKKLSEMTPAQLRKHFNGLKSTKKLRTKAAKDAAFRKYARKYGVKGGVLAGDFY